MTGIWRKPEVPGTRTRVSVTPHAFSSFPPVLLKGVRDQDQYRAPCLTKRMEGGQTFQGTGLPRRRRKRDRGAGKKEGGERGPRNQRSSDSYPRIPFFGPSASRAPRVRH